MVPGVARGAAGAVPRATPVHRPWGGDPHAVEADARSWRYGVKKMCGADGGRVMRLSGALAVPYGFCR